MPHPVICSVCGKRFDRDVEPAVQTGARRYAHAACCPDNKQILPIVVKKEKVKTKEDEELEALKNYINNLYGASANWQMITKQIKQYKKDYKYSYTGMLKSLIWFYEVKGNSTENSNGGVGIIPYVYQDAYNYYYNLFVIQSQNKNVNTDLILNNRVREIIIPTPEIKEKKRMFKLQDDEEEN